MNAERLLQHYEKIADAPDAIARLRRFILDLAVRGKLVPQDANDEPASELLKRIGREKARLVKAGELRKPRDLDTGSGVVELYSIPSTWRWVRLDGVGAIVGGGTPSATDADNFAEPGEGVPWLTPADLGGYSELYISRGSRDLSEKGARTSSATLMPKGTVLFTSRAPIGYVAIAANPLSTNQGFKSIVPYVADCSRFIATAMQAFAPEIDAKAPGTTFKEVSGKIVAAVPFPLPPLAEQHRIVAKVDEFMDLCDRLEAARAGREAVRDRLTVASLARLNAPDPETFQNDARFALEALPALTTRPDQIKRLRQTILNLAVRGKLVPQDPNDEPAINFDRAIPFDLERPFEIPRTWHWARLHALGKLKGGGTPSKAREDFWDGNIPWVSPKDMKIDYIAEAQMSITEAAIAGSAANLIDAGSVLFVVRGMILAHSFPVAISLAPLAINQDMKALVLKKPEMGEYVLRALKGVKPEMLKRVQRSSHGTCRLEGSDYSDFLIPIPPLAEQHRIVAKVDALMALCDRLEASLTAATATRRRLLDALLAEALAPVGDFSDDNIEAVKQVLHA